MIEMLVRLGVALFLSLVLAVLLAWGWDSSDDHPTPLSQPAQCQHPCDAPETTRSSPESAFVSRFETHANRIDKDQV
ncbi:MAG: hypothetical protein KJ677_09595 [Gammaproteobacteria bacterium]|nr:hypothetical protein [Gammaproteobacteria bacterium]MBV1731487.1 hypothetical protein [Hydrogenophaga sp.]